jgi:membrane-bound ClpP family serine protease
MGVSFREPSVVRVTQVGLLIASLGAAMVIFGILGIIGLFLAVGGAAMAAAAGWQSADLSRS